MRFQFVMSITGHISSMDGARKLREVFDKRVQGRILEGMRADLPIEKRYTESLPRFWRHRPDLFDHCQERTLEKDLVRPFILAMFVPTDQRGAVAPRKLQSGAHKSAAALPETDPTIGRDRRNPSVIRSSVSSTFPIPLVQGTQHKWRQECSTSMRAATDQRPR